MRQVWITRKGPPEVLEVREAPDPEPGPGELRVRSKACGVNFADTSARIGLYPDAPPIPCVIGYEVAGIVDAAGPGADASRIGERVIAFTRFGGYSDVVVIPEATAVPMPDEMSFSEGAAIPVQYLTAHHMLVYLGNVQKEHTVLIHAVAGGVGQAALQLCKSVGARTIGTASGHKHGFLKEAGLDVAIDYHVDDFEEVVMRETGGRGVDIALDAQMGDNSARSLRCLAPTGRLFFFGAASFQATGKLDPLRILGGLIQTPFFQLHPMRLLNKNIGVFGINLAHLWSEIDLLNRQVANIIRLWEQGHVKPVIDSEIPFDRAPDAHRRLGEHKNIGKVLLIP